MSSEVVPRLRFQINQQDQVRQQLAMEVRREEDFVRGINKDNRKALKDQMKLIDLLGVGDYLKEVAEGLNKVTNFMRFIFTTERFDWFAHGEEWPFPDEASGDALVALSGFAFMTFIPDMDAVSRPSPGRNPWAPFPGEYHNFYALMIRRSEQPADSPLPHRDYLYLGPDHGNPSLSYALKIGDRIVERRKQKRKDDLQQLFREDISQYLDEEPRTVQQYSSAPIFNHLFGCYPTTKGFFRKRTEWEVGPLLKDSIPFLPQAIPTLDHEVEHRFMQYLRGIPHFPMNAVERAV